MRKKLLVAICCTVVAVLAIAAGYRFVRALNNKEAFSNERAYRGAIDRDLVYYDFNEPIARDPVITDHYEEIRKAAMEAFEILNTERAAQNHEPLMWAYALEECAQIRSEEIACAFEKGHVRPDGTDWYLVNPSVMLGENIYKGKLSADKVMESWLKNDADKENFMSDTFTKTGISIFSTADGEYYWVAAFGSDLTDIIFENDIQPAQAWILRDTEGNRHTSVWGTAMINADELEKEYHPGIPTSADNKYLFRMIDDDGIYYETDIPELQNNWKLKVDAVSSETDIHLEIFNENGELVHDCEVFSAAL